MKILDGAWSRVRSAVWRFRKIFRRGERQTCPRRLSEFGPWERTPGLDVWALGSWTRFDRWWSLFESRILRQYVGGTRWRWGWIPRVCSFCGGIRPDDAIRLLSEGWEVEPTDKVYKRYLHPPGYSASVAAWTCRLSDDGARVRSPQIEWSPVPPVKLYTHHFQPAQVERFNEVYHRGKIQRHLVQ